MYGLDLMEIFYFKMQSNDDGQNDFPSPAYLSPDIPFDGHGALLAEDTMSIISKKSSESNDNALSTPQDSEYVSIQKFDHSPTEEPLHRGIDEEALPEEDDADFKSFADYGFSRQLSSPTKSDTPSHPSSPYDTKAQKLTPPSHEYSTPQRLTLPHLEKEFIPGDQTSEDEPSPRISPRINKMDPPTSEDEKIDEALSSPQVSSPYGAGSTSSAMRGARELLKKNRQERLAFMSKRRAVSQKTPKVRKSPKDDSNSASNENSDPMKRKTDPSKAKTDPSKTKTLYSHSRSRSVTPNKKRFYSESRNTLSPGKKALEPLSPSRSVVPKTPPSSVRKSPRQNVYGSPSAKSDVSGASSDWTAEDPDPGDKDSRRALILKMAKNRMRNKKK